MKNLILIILLSTSIYGCAKPKDVNCYVFFKYDAEGHRHNGFWFRDGGYEVDVTYCTKIHPMED